MIPDSQTNTLYLADCLPTKHPKFFADFEAVLKKCGITFHLLPGTKEIWVVDYMPVQVTLEKFVQFVYKPDYLQSLKWIKTISDVDSICNSIKLNRIKSDIVLDGGNVTKTADKVIMCDKIFIENPHYSRRQLADKLRELFEVDKLYFVPPLERRRFKCKKTIYWWDKFFKTNHTNYGKEFDQITEKPLFLRNP